MYSHLKCVNSGKRTTVDKHTHTHPHPHSFNGPLSGTTRVSRYQKGKTSMDFTEARDSEWQWHQLGAICKSAPRSRQITMPATHHSVFLQPFLLPNQQCQSTIYITVDKICDILAVTATIKVNEQKCYTLTNTYSSIPPSCSYPPYPP